MCPADQSPAAAVSRFMLSLGVRWRDMAVYLGYTPTENSSIAEQHPSNPELQVRGRIKECVRIQESDCDSFHPPTTHTPPDGTP